MISARKFQREDATINISLQRRSGIVRDTFPKMLANDIIIEGGGWNVFWNLAENIT